jgi:hypothetical protein
MGIGKGVGVGVGEGAGVFEDSFGEQLATSRMPERKRAPIIAIFLFIILLIIRQYGISM